jgi:hypothetical protein
MVRRALRSRAVTARFRVGIWEQVRLYLARPCVPSGSRRCQVRYLASPGRPIRLPHHVWTRRAGPAAALAAEVEDLLNWRKSVLEVDAMDLKAVLTNSAVERLL